MLGLALLVSVFLAILTVGDCVPVSAVAPHSSQRNGYFAYGPSASGGIVLPDGTVTQGGFQGANNGPQGGAFVAAAADDFVGSAVGAAVGSGTSSASGSVSPGFSTVDSKHATENRRRRRRPRRT